MLRSAPSKVVWVGRTASMVLGLALVLALLFGVASMVFAANGNSFVLGVLNNSATTVTRLVGNVNGSTLQVLNTNAGTDDTALDLKVQAGEAPMTVNSGKVVSNLNADKIDGKDSSALLTRDAFLSATVLNNGDLIVTSHSGTAATRTATGTYLIDFPPSASNLLNCTMVATAEHPDTPMFAVVDGIDLATNAVTLETYNVDGAPVDPYYLHFVAHCGPSASGSAQVFGSDEAAR